MYEVRFAADEELMELIKWMRSHLSHRFPKGVSYQDIFKYAMRYVREREDMAKRAERRKKRNAREKRPSASTKPRAGIPSHDRVRRSDEVSPSRHIATREKEKVWVRDNGRCAYVGSNGRRCNSTHNLQYDHYPVPFARGGPSTVDNLRLLCARHNRHTAERVYGKHELKQFRQ
jgi:hypothetical protein